ncbi:ubiquitin-transferase domain-containing protein [Cyclospora cayetanensis]|uniref:Ubiquitin-transferase domain-containing protein n=1 Tax=Cyclospora cayetanensis TaxID=88456 RepID=A0A1D3CYE5_9EIME|nr:ubiquitin-transferase domain-containing protein [Cyclospora cayetanensis]
MLARAVSHRGPSSSASPPAAPAGGPSSGGGSQPQSDEASRTTSLQQLNSECLTPPHFAVFMWGLNDSGQLLSGAQPPSNTPPEIHTGGDAAAAPGCPPLGGPRGAPPTAVERLENKSICGCCLGLERTWVWDVTQNVWGGGDNEGGCLDPEGEAFIRKPKLSDAVRGAVSVATGESHTIAVLDNGSAIAFGSNEFGQLGRGPSARVLRTFAPQAMQLDRSRPLLQGQGGGLRAPTSSFLPGSVWRLLFPGFDRDRYAAGLRILIARLSGDWRGDSRRAAATTVAASNEHALALSISGEVFSWGSNKWGRLGLGEAFDSVKNVWTPTLVRLSLRVRYVAASDTHSGLVVSGGLLYLCGSNSYGELSYPVGPLPASRDRLPRNAAEEAPIAWSSRFLLVRSLQQHKIKVVALGRHFTVALTRSGKVYSWGVNDVNQLGVSSKAVFPLSPYLGEEAAPPKPHTPQPQLLWLPSESSVQQQLFFYLIAAGPFTAFAAAVETQQGGAEEGHLNQSLETFFKKVLCRSRSSVGWEYRKLTAASHSIAMAAQLAGGMGRRPSIGGSSAGGASGPCAVQRLLTLSRGESNLVSVEAPGGSQGSMQGPPDQLLSRQESSTQEAASFFLSGVSVEEVLSLLEGARSTGDLSALRSMVTQVFGDVFRLNSSFAYPGHGSVPDFEGLTAVYGQLPAELLPLVCQSFSLVVSNTIKMAQFLRRPDQLKFILFMLACTPIYASFCERGSQEGSSGSTKPEKHEDTGAGSQGGLAETGADRGTSDKPQEIHLQAQRPDTRGELLYTAVIHMLFHLPADGKRSFLRLAKEFPDSIFETALVFPACRFLAHALSTAGSRYRIVDRVWHCAALLQLLYHANLSSNRKVILGGGRGTKIPIEKFQVEEIGVFVDPIKEVGAYIEIAPRAAQQQDQQNTQAVKEQRYRPVRLFELERDVVNNSELQSGWSLFMAHLNLCPLSFKRNVLLVDNVYRQHHMSLQSLLNTQLPFLIVRVRRSAAVTDACRFLGSSDPKDLLRPLKVIFDGEEGVDEGGLRREFFSPACATTLWPPFTFFAPLGRSVLCTVSVHLLAASDSPCCLLRCSLAAQLLTRELFSPSRGLFSYKSGVRTMWFQQQDDVKTGTEPGNAAGELPSILSTSEGCAEPQEAAAVARIASREGETEGEGECGADKGSKQDAVPEGKAKEYWVTGLLAAMAVYNDILMPLNLPLVIYKRLQGAEVTLDDLSDVFPEELHSFEKLLEIDNEATFNEAFEGMTFAVDVELPGGRRGQVALKPAGETVALTIHNRQEFVHLYTRYLLVTSVDWQYSHFERGFQLIAPPLVGSLTGKELQLLICGTPELDFNELKESCRYEGYAADCPYIRSLWEILTSFDIFQKQNFLKFVSGSERSPAFGLKELRLVIQKNGGEPTERLPTSFTCFCTLLLPEYASKEKLQRLLTIAIEASEGFGLQ